MAIHNCSMNEAIDIIRDKADADYLEAITSYCQNDNQSENENDS